MCIFSSLALKNLYGKRCDGNPNVKYFTSDDFEGLKKEPIEFTSDRGHKLRGYVYTYGETTVQTAKNLVIFSHGMFGGHLSYTTEINTFAKDGNAVLAYDNTGTFESEGPELYCFSQAPRDLRKAIDFALGNPEFSHLPIVLVGHSWGGHSVLANLPYVDALNRVKAAIAMSPPEAGNVGAAGMILGGKAVALAPALLPAFLGRDGMAAFTRASRCVRQNTHTRVLILHGAEDKTVPVKCSPLRDKRIFTQPNVTAIIYPEKNHNVYQTLRSEKYMNDTLGAIGKVPKKDQEKRLEMYRNIDYTLMTEEDPEVMATILDFINKKG